MWALLLVLGLVYYLATYAREKFIVKAGGPDYYNTDVDGNGYEVIASSPDTCGSRNDGKVDEDGGLCYELCGSGYYGVGPVCWAFTSYVGVGQPIGLEPCPAGWTNDGLTCRQPISCEPITCAKGLDFFKKGCTGGGCSGGKIKGRLDNGGICDWPEDRGNLPSWLRKDVINETPGPPPSKVRAIEATHPVKIDGMCYAKCPTDKPNRVPGMPYLCYKSYQGKGLSYGRGAGVIPALGSLFGYQVGGG